MSEQSHREMFMLEEFKMLKAEIAVLDRRVDRGITTMLVVNAFAIAAIYIDYLPGLGTDRVDPAQLTKVDQPLSVLLMFLNIMFALRNFYNVRHINDIGFYISNMETNIYRNEPVELGWELSLRNDQDKEVKQKKFHLADGFRLFGFWVFLALVNTVVILDVFCIIPIPGASSCLQP